MFNWILKQILGSKNQRELKRLAPIVRRINELDEQFKSLSDDDLRAKTFAWKQRLAPVDDFAEREAILNEILPEAFAAVRNAARRLCGKSWLVCDQPVTWNMVHFDVQLIGGMVLHSGRIAEMATGEGKTLVATLPLYLNALTGPRLAPGDGQRLPRPPRRRMDGRALPLSRPDLRLHPARPIARTSAARSTPATSPTASTANSASITCATTAWPPAASSRSSAATFSPSWTRSIPS